MNGPLTYKEYSVLLALIDAKLEKRLADDYALVNAGPHVRPRVRAAEETLSRAANAAFARLVLGQEP